MIPTFISSCKFRNLISNIRLFCVYSLIIIFGWVSGCMIRGKVQLWVAYVSKNFDDVKMPRDEMWVSYEFHALRNLKIAANTI